MNKEAFLQRFHHLHQIEPAVDYPLTHRGRDAAVLVPIINHPEGLTVLFSKRATHLKHHAGQVSFPGGKLEPNDKSLRHAALREAHEEMGLNIDPASIIGEFQPYRTVSGFRVTPIISIIEPGFELVLDPGEVSAAFEVPLAHLIDEDNHLVHVVKRRGKSMPIYFIPYEQQMIWGVTGAIVHLLARHLNASKSLQSINLANATD